MKNVFLLLITVIIFASCDKNNIVEEKNISFKFTFNWDGEPVSLEDFNQIKYTNQHGEMLSIERLRYLISDITLHNLDKDIIVGDYNLVDLTNSTGLTYNPNISIPVDQFDKVSFNFGFNDIRNNDTYPDLNTANWHWPEMLGGGYHFMQFEGKYLDTDGNPQGFAYHNGTARVNEGVFEANDFNVSFDRTINLTDNLEVEIKMNIAEWFKNPDTWDLNVLHAPLMPNYEAQKMMHRNGATVFSLGNITIK